MTFSSSIFLFVFFPCFLFVMFISQLLCRKFPALTKIRLQDILIILFSFVFYAWALFDHVFYLIVLTVLVFLAGQLINHFTHKEQPGSRGASGGRRSPAFWIYFLTISLMISALWYFKYTQTYNLFPDRKIYAPLGISFIVFSVISYVADVYHGQGPGNYLDVALYISFFPKVISGPIVTWDDFSSQIDNRSIDLSSYSEGFTQLIIGLAKKVILADYFGSVISTININSKLAIDIPTAWLICFLYMFQIYYDFSGYSDIASGLASFTGFHFGPNFNFPYLSTSISEFWRRWHISLGNWFKKYVYIPLGGNRKSKARTLANLFVVMLLSGIWHGAGAGYLLWGITHGLCIVVERLLSDSNFYKKTPKLIKWMVTMLIVMIGWEIFRLGSFSSFREFIYVLFGVTRTANPVFTYEFYFSTKVIIMLVIATVGSTLFYYISKLKWFQKFKSSVVYEIVIIMVLLLLFIASITCIASSTYHPFLYFQY